MLVIFLVVGTVMELRGHQVSTPDSINLLTTAQMNAAIGVTLTIGIIHGVVYNELLLFNPTPGYLEKIAVFSVGFCVHGMALEELLTPAGSRVFSLGFLFVSAATAALLNRRSFRKDARQLSE